ncbi:MAG: hypothetical protein J0I21_18920 [Alphaproteobacteria bacterium]|nr:hypothetical protein [Alphaproteobacteria bacterium]
MTEVTAEWVVVADDVAIVSCQTAEFWFVELGAHRAMLPFASPMTGEGTPGSTAGLLDGAIALAFSGGEREPHRFTSLARYVFDLAGAYHNARRTPGHFRRAAKRLRGLGRPEIAEYLEFHAREETGHDKLVLKDLRALGLPAERIVANLDHEGVRPLCAFFDALVEVAYPVGCIGYSYCFEATAALKGREEVDALTALWPRTLDAARFLRTHSGLGSEVSHVQDMIGFIASLPAADRIEIAKATYATALLMAEGLERVGAIPDSAILARIEAAAGEKVHLQA